MAASPNQRDDATGSSSAVKKRGGHDEEDASQYLVTKSSSTLIGSDPSDQEVLVQEEPTPDDIPAGWTTRAKLEPSSASRKRPRMICLAESREIAASTNQTNNATGSYIAVKNDDGHHEEDASPSLGTARMEQIGSDSSDLEVLVPEAPTTDDIPAGWTRTKLEPDW